MPAASESDVKSRSARAVRPCRVPYCHPQLSLSPRTLRRRSLRLKQRLHLPLILSSCCRMMRCFCAVEKLSWHCSLDSSHGCSSRQSLGERTFLQLMSVHWAAVTPILWVRAEASAPEAWVLVQTFRSKTKCRANCQRGHVRKGLAMTWQRTATARIVIRLSTPLEAMGMGNFGDLEAESVSAPSSSSGGKVIQDRGYGDDPRRDERDEPRNTCQQGSPVFSSERGCARHPTPSPTAT